MTSETESGSDSSSLSKIFETSGLTEIVSNKLPEGCARKWLVNCNRCNEPVTRKQALMVCNSKIIKFSKKNECYELKIFNFLYFFIFFIFLLYNMKIFYIFRYK
uniref:Uncharacterized protein n=1 Tax=Elaeophora elaphi TaxID=1147741 RepID=A0A0R3RGK0_9BILA